MIKGHTKLELFDALTGRVKERIEDDNMFTNAISKMVDFTMRHSYRENGLSNLYTEHFSFLQGLCLFDSQLPEDPDLVWLPAGIKPTAYGVINYENSNANMLQMGTYNTSESDTSQPLTKKFVWDWNTQQGNGNIACASLTHYRAGFLGFGDNQQGAPCFVNVGNQNKFIALSEIVVKAEPGKVSISNNQYTYFGTVNDSYLDFCIDSDNDYKYMFLVKTNGLSIIRHKMSPKYFDIFRKVNINQPYEEEWYPHSFSGTKFQFFYNTDEQMLYFWLGGNDRYGNGSSMMIYKFDMQNKTLGEHGTWRNQTGANVNSNLVVTNTAVYEQKADSYNYIYKYSFSSNTTTILQGQNNSSHSEADTRKQNAYILSGIITYSWGKRIKNASVLTPDVIIDTSDDTVRYTINRATSLFFDTGYISFAVIPPLKNTQVAFGTGTNENQRIRNGLNFENGDINVGNTFSLTNYIGTINNLPQTIVKTATQTMKLTYTITAEEAETDENKKVT